MTTHFIGIGGIGMSALARILLQQGQTVKGSDRKASALLEELRKEGATIQIGHDAKLIAPGDTVVYSTDIPMDHVELQHAKTLDCELLHRSALLHRLLKQGKPLLVTGTHGKTTTTALLATVLLEAGLDPTFAIGGILRSCNINGRAGSGMYCVAESDESDGSFLATPAYGAIVTNLEKEHLNYWKTEQHLRQGFKEFCAKVENPQQLFWCGDDPGLSTLGISGVAYGFGAHCDCRIECFTPTQKGLLFDLRFQGKFYSGIELALFGKHNALNGAAVFGLGLTLGLDEQVLRRAFATFSGTERRLEKLGEIQNIEIYDDYGHHPTEIEVTLKALRDLIHERRLVVIFQPHRISRVCDLFEEFAASFQHADLVLMTDIYTAGEAPIEGIHSAALYAKLQEQLGSRVHFFERQKLEEQALAVLRPGDTVLTLGAGDVTSVGKTLLDRIREQPPKLNIGVFFGGASAEHEVSLLSANTILEALDPSLYNIQTFKIEKDGSWDVDFNKLKQCDVCIPVLHGPRGEDGMMQGLFDAFNIPYVGCNYQASVICMQKAWTKQVALFHGIPTAPYLEIRKKEWREDPESVLEAVASISYPVWVKPVHLGSSIGVSRAIHEQEMVVAIERAFALDDTLIIEQEIDGKQIEFAMLGNERVRIGIPGEVLNDGQFYDYDKKYGENAVGAKIPASLTPLQEEVGLDLARRVYLACGCAGLARIDFFLDRSGHYWLLEVNPFPGCTKTSLYPKMWETAGLTMRALCNEWIVLALHRHRHLKKP